MTRFGASPFWQSPLELTVKLPVISAPARVELMQNGWRGLYLRTRFGKRAASAGPLMHTDQRMRSSATGASAFLKPEVNAYAIAGGFAGAPEENQSERVVADEL